jgi:hypothetical protein
MNSKSMLAVFAAFVSIALSGCGVGAEPQEVNAEKTEQSKAALYPSSCLYPYCETTDGLYKSPTQCQKFCGAVQCSSYDICL